MKEQQVINQLSEGFNFALYLTPTRFNDKKGLSEIEEGLDKMTLSLNLDKNVSSIELSKNPSELKNYIDKDLLQKIEDSSPLKSVMSSKTGINNSYLNLNDSKCRDQDQNEFINLTENISNFNGKQKVREFSDDQSNKFEIRPIRMNLLDNNNTINEIKKEEDYNSTSSTNFNSKLSSFNSPNFMYSDNLSNRKSMTAENKIPNMIDAQNKIPMFNYNNQFCDSTYYESPIQAKDMGPYSYNSSIFNSQNNNMTQFKNYPMNNNYNVQSGLQNMNGNNMNHLPMYNLNRNGKKNEKKKKGFEERIGDWVCMKCKNLNFSFRMICNRCKIPKADSEKLYEEHLKNLYNYVKINEMYQSQVFSQQNYCQNPNFVVPNTSFSPYNNGFLPNTMFNSQYMSNQNQNCNNLNVYSNESLNNGYN